MVRAFGRWRISRSAKGADLIPQLTQKGRARWVADALCWARLASIANVCPSRLRGSGRFLPGMPSRI